MSRIKALTVLVAFVVFAVTPSMFAASVETQETISIDVTATAPSKVCHPKKPITCRANDVSALSLTEQVVGPIGMAKTEAPVAKTDEAMAPASFTPDSGRVCVGPRWCCRAAALN